MQFQRHNSSPMKASVARERWSLYLNVTSLFPPRFVLHLREEIFATDSAEKNNGLRRTMRCKWKVGQLLGFFLFFLSSQKNKRAAAVQTWLSVQKRGRESLVEAKQTFVGNSELNCWVSRPDMSPLERLPRWCG